MSASVVNTNGHDATSELAESATSNSSDTTNTDLSRGYGREQEDEPALGRERGRSDQSSGRETQLGYRVYKRRFFGLLQLVLLNIVVSWDWLSFSPVVRFSAEYFNTSDTAINWLSTAFLFAFCIGAPFTIIALSRAGPKAAIVVASCLLLVGNWTRYLGTRYAQFGAVMAGQILVGLAQPFVLSAPTRYSDVWFSDRGRVSATAVASLANPFGGALAQLINPLWASKPSDIPNMILYVSIISTVACLPSLFVPETPPSPPSASAASAVHNQARHERTQTGNHPISISQELSSLSTSVVALFQSPPNLLIIIPFWTYVALFNSLSSLLAQILLPYSYTETESGIAGGVLIVAGLVCAALSSPIIDRHKAYLPHIKTTVPTIAICYIIVIFVPQIRSIILLNIILAVLGAASFGLVPVALEFLVEISWPLPPEVGSTVCWTGGQLLGGIFIIVQTELKDAGNADPPFNMKRALIFQAAMACLVVPLPLWLGCKGAQFKKSRLLVDKAMTGTTRTTTTEMHGRGPTSGV